MVTKEQIDYSLWGITWLVVSEELRGRGIGSELLSTLEKFAAGRQGDYPSDECLVLLTTTIPTFYAERGYEAICDWSNTTLMIKDLTGKAAQI
jgi:GNAT superfamily N-acetyltransferase